MNDAPIKNSSVFCCLFLIIFSPELLEVLQAGLPISLCCRRTWTRCLWAVHWPQRGFSWSESDASQNNPANLWLLSSALKLTFNTQRITFSHILMTTQSLTSEDRPYQNWFFLHFIILITQGILFREPCELDSLLRLWMMADRWGGGNHSNRRLRFPVGSVIHNIYYSFSLKLYYNKNYCSFLKYLLILKVSKL